VYRLRVSLSTSIFSELALLKPLALTAQELDDSLATCTPGTRRSTSGIVVAPERMMSAVLRTVMAAAASDNASSLRDTDVTMTLASCSSEYERRSSGERGWG
jgi:hypothetical protein